MDRPLINPLTNDHLEAINAAIAHEQEMLDLLDRCEKCTVQIGQRRQIYEEAIKVAKLIKTNFFPDRA